MNIPKKTTTKQVKSRIFDKTPKKEKANFARKNKNLYGRKNLDEFLEWESKTKLTDEKLKKKIVSVLKINNTNDILQMSKAEREQAVGKIMQINGANVLQVSRITGVPYHFIRYLE